MMIASSPGFTAPIYTSQQATASEFNEGRYLKIEREWKFVYKESRNCPRRLQRTWRVNADEFQLFANVAKSAIRGRFTAIVQWPHDHRGANRETINSLPEFRDGA